MLEIEKNNLNKMIKKIDHKLEKMDGIRMNVNDGRSIILSQEEIKVDAGSQEFSANKESKTGDTKFSFRSDDFINSPEPLNMNYEDYIQKHSKALASIKEEDSPARLPPYEDYKQSAELKKSQFIHEEIEEMTKSKEKPPELQNIQENNEVQFMPKDEIKAHEDPNKIKELQYAFSQSLNKIRFEENFNSRVENTVFESFEHSPTKENEQPEIFNNNLLAEIKSNQKNDESSSNDSHMSQGDEPESPIGILKGCDPVKKVIVF